LALLKNGYPFIIGGFFVIAENIRAVKERIADAAARAGRIDKITLVAVTKNNPVAAVLAAAVAGITVVGENRVQEANQKFSDIYKQFPNTNLHIIGSLQRNKVKDAVKIASCIESVDRLELMDEIEKQCTKLNKTISVLFELHTGEESKSGFENFDKLFEAVSLCAEGKYPHLIPNGFMTMAPLSSDEQNVRLSFITLRESANRIKKEFPELPLKELSMGMSNDFKLAIKEGSTIVRIGTAIFGPRDYSK